MNSFEINQLDSPVQFWTIFSKSLNFYRYSFFGYLLISVIAFAPLLIFNQFSQSNLLEIIEFIHGAFVDILVFLTFPTLFSDKKIYPAATVQMFLQRFFASAVLIGLIQMCALFLSLSIFASISFGLILIGFIPYIFLVFSGFFLIFGNSNRVIDVNKNLLQSIQTVRQFFAPVFLHMILITFITMIPMLIFSFWFISNHPEFAALIQTGEQGTAVPGYGTKVFSLIQEIIQTSSFQWGRIGLHILLRPLKSIFLSILFLTLLFKLTPESVSSFLGLSSDKEATTDLDDTPSSTLS